MLRLSQRGSTPAWVPARRTVAYAGDDVGDVNEVLHLDVSHYP
jgi:hypothetical protein